MHPGRLLISRRFSGMFATQFLGALNDNLFKNALLMLVTYHLVVPDLDAAVLVNLSAGLFILPFFLFSPLSGQLADIMERSRLIRRIKMAEIFIMALGAAALLLGSLQLLLVVLFLMGAQSAFFGPVKYAILPQLLEPDELVGGNALVELGTFLAILLGTIAGGLAMGDAASGPVLVSGTVITLAVMGWLTAGRVPHAPAGAGALKLDWNLWRAGASAFRFAYARPPIWLSIMGISWFWFYGLLFLTQVTPYTRELIGGSEQVATLLLAAFSVGIGIGSIACERMSGRRVELGLVPIGAVGMSLFGVDLGLAWDAPTSDELLSVSQFLAAPGSTRLLLDIIGLSVSAGIFVVPLFAYVQQESPAAERARILAANNMLNALFMVAAALSAAGFLAAGLSIPQLFIAAALMNIAVCAFIFHRIPEFLMRLIVWLLIHTIYRIEKQDLDNIPARGAAVLVCNHVSFVDGLIIAAICPRPVRFVMDHRIFATPVLSFAFRVGGAIPIASAKDNHRLMEQAFEEVQRALDAGQLVCIFPEGRITHDGEMNPFRAGIERIVQATPVPVIPLALRGMWGSYFSRKGGNAMNGIPRTLWYRMSVVSGLPVAPGEVTASALHDLVLTLRGEQR